MQKRTKESEQRKMPMKTARTFKIWAVDTAEVPRTKVRGKMLGELFALPINASAVSLGGLTAIILPRRASGEGRRYSIRRLMYLLYMKTATWNIHLEK